MAIIRSAFGDDHLTIGPTSKAARVGLTGVDHDRARSTAFVGRRAFSATGSFSQAGSATDLITISGSPSSIIRVVSFIIEPTSNAGGSAQYFLIKRSGHNTVGIAGGSGVFNPLNPVAHDPEDNGRATAAVGHYTTNADVIAQFLGTINVVRIAVPRNVPDTFIINPYPRQEMLQGSAFTRMTIPFTLRRQEVLALNFNAAANLVGLNLSYRILWYEEDPFTL